MSKEKNPVMPSEVSHSVGAFDHFAEAASRVSSRAWFFCFCVLLVVLWAPSIIFLRDIDTWQFIINTLTTIVTFLMVFLIQNTQNRDTEAIQVKLDELIRATKGAHNALLDLEELEEDVLDAFRKKYQALASSARTDLGLGSDDTGTPEA